jgi:trk system potassium uptake protein TrkH
VRLSFSPLRTPRPALRIPRAPSPITVVWALAILIVVGTFLLMLPVAARDGTWTDPLTALFTSASAACTTGLTLVDTRSHWSMFGQVVLVLLMQVGGLGFLTGSTLVLLLIGGRLTLRGRLLAQEALGEGTLADVGTLVRHIVLFALAVEGVGALLLTCYFLPSEPPNVAVWFGIFHAVSAFTNSSFDLLHGLENVNGRPGEPFLLLVLSLLIVLGGISYTVVADVWRRRRFQRLSLDSKLVLVTTALLLVMGAAGFYLMEYGNERTIGPLSVPRALMQAAFFAVVPRSSGFQTLNPAEFRDETLVFLSFLMFIGGAAGSTAGGIKVGALAVLAVAVMSAVRGQNTVTAYRREIPIAAVMRTLTVVTLSAAVVLGGAFALTVVTPFRFLNIIFETTSAFGTVGLTTGVTARLTTAGKLIIVAAMFAGRLGPLTLAVALAQRAQTSRLRYPQAQIRIG